MAVPSQGEVAGFPLGTDDAKALSYNAASADYIFNSTAYTWLNRLGQTRQTMAGHDKTIADKLSQFDSESSAALNDFQVLGDNLIFSTGFMNVGVFGIGETVQNAQETLTYNSEEFNTTAGPFPYTITGATPDLDPADWFNVTIEDRKTVARSLNVLDSQVVYSSDTITSLDNVLYIYDSLTQVTYSKPSTVASGDKITSLVGRDLNTTTGSHFLEYSNVGVIPTTTLAAMRSLTVPYSQVRPSGYHVAGDGAFGSAYFEWNPLSIEVDNGGTTIKLNGIATGRYELQYTGAISVGWFGPNLTELLTQSIIDKISAVSGPTAEVDFNGSFTATEVLSWRFNTNAIASTIYTDYGIIHGRAYDGTPDAVDKNIISILPRIVPITDLGANVYHAGAGVTLTNMEMCDITVQEVGTENGGWDVGLLLWAEYAGFAWNKVKFLYAKNNLINVQQDGIGHWADLPYNGDGFNNANEVSCVRLYKKPEIPANVNSVQIQVLKGGGNTYWAPRVEQNTFPIADPKPGSFRLIDCHGSDNAFIRAHTEAPSVGVDDPTITFDGGQRNYVSFGGDGSGFNIKVLEINGAQYNRADRGEWGETRELAHPIVFQHGFNANRSVLEVLDFTYSGSVDIQNRNGGENDYWYRITGKEAKFKRSPDTFDRTIISTDKIYTGRGALDPKELISPTREYIGMFANNVLISPIRTNYEYLTYKVGINKLQVDFTFYADYGGPKVTTGTLDAVVQWTGSVLTVLHSTLTTVATGVDFDSFDVSVHAALGTNQIQVRAKCLNSADSGISVDYVQNITNTLII